MNAPYTAKDFAADQEVRWRKLPRSILILAFLAVVGCTTPTAVEEFSQSIVQSTHSTDPNASQSTITFCMAQKNYQGCCSKNAGMSYFEGASLICNNDETSPTCTREVDDQLRGCCSQYGGISSIELDGTVNCADGNVSPSCRFKPTCS